MKASSPRRHTLTQRVVWAVTGTVALLVGLQTALAYAAIYSQEDELTDESLRRETQQLIGLTLRPGLMPVGALEASPRVTAYLVRGEQGVAQVPVDLRALPPGLHQLTTQGRDWHVSVVDTEDGRLTVVLDATDSEDRVNRLLGTLLVLWLLCVAVTFWLARGVAAIAVGPIVDATRSIADLGPLPPLSKAGRRDEAGLLMETFNLFRDRADEAVAREREFAANLDHELRTPLTTIRTDAELCDLDGGLLPNQQLRITRIMQTVDDIIDMTESTLFSRAEKPGALETVDLSECIRSVALSFAERAAHRGLGLLVEVQPGESALLDRQAFLTVCRNILKNALEHAAPATLTIRGDRSAIVFQDDGPGILAEHLPHVFERYRQAPRTDADPGFGGPRRGLGLSISRRICAQCGWLLEAASPIAADGRGTRFTLSLLTAA